MAHSPRPSVRFRRIGGALRQAREERRLTLETAARRFGRSQGWLSTVENGVQIIRVDDLTDLLDFYGIPEGVLRSSLLHLAAQGRRKNWAHAFEDRISPGALDLVSLETDSELIRSFQPSLIPGLLQTEDYARSVIETGLPSTTRNNDELVAFRKARQQIHTNTQPPTYQALITEATIHQVVGNTTVMRNQLQHLIAVARMDHVSIRMLPYEASAYLWINIPFDLLFLRPPGSLTIAVVEHLARSIFYEEVREVAYHEEVFEHIWAAALDESLSMQTIERIMSGS